MKLTRNRLLKGPNWDKRQESEYLQLNQYNKEGKFGLPTHVENDATIFHLVWTYNIKALNLWKKARCVCAGSPRAGQAHILNETYINCVNQTSSCMFYRIAVAENLLIYRADVSNAFTEAPPLKQGFYIYPDCAFHEWWTKHLNRPPLNQGHVIPVLLAMQGHPESPRLWEKHANSILRDLCLTTSVHKPCPYSGTVDGKHVILKQQVDDFAIATPDESTANILLDLINNELSIPMKRQGYLDMYNGIDVLQMQDYIKITTTTYINKITKKYLSSWMQNFTTTEDRPTPLPLDRTWLKKFNAAIGNPDPTIQKKLAQAMQLTYCSGVGELIRAMTTTHPDLAYASVKLSQANCCPHDHHYHGVKHAFKYLYPTCNNASIFGVLLCAQNSMKGHSSV
jgi:hypothetical protein